MPKKKKVCDGPDRTGGCLVAVARRFAIRFDFKLVAITGFAFPLALEVRSFLSGLVLCRARMVVPEHFYGGVSDRCSRWAPRFDLKTGSSFEEQNSRSNHETISLALARVLYKVCWGLDA